MGKPEKTIDTVIFDMDGTLFDTERIYRGAWLEAGVPLSLYQTFIGTGAAYIEQKLAEHGLDPGEITAEKTRITNRELAKGIPLKPGCREILAWLRERGYHTGIATSSAVAVAERYLEASGLGDSFDEVISGYTLERGKPFPDVFFMAAEQLRARPERCMVVEDSFNGVRAGHAAGMYTVMIPDLVEPDEEIRGLADAVLPSLLSIRELLQR